MKIKLKAMPTAVLGVLNAGLLASLSMAAFAQPAPSASDQKVEKVEVTGSRLKRAEAETALPVTVIDRAAIEASGEASVAELLRTVTFSSFGNFKPQSGSSAQALSDIDLRGLGSNRTLVLIDGRRAPKAPFVGSVQDLNAVPLAAVERIEILTDGASAVYGSDAIGGVVNVITRKNFNGLQATYGESNPEVTGGDVREASILIGTSGKLGRVFAGISSNSRGMIFTRDQIGLTRGVSTFGNNYRLANAAGTAPTGGFIPYPGFACNSNGFYFTNPGAANNICAFDFNSVAANEASVDNRSLFANGEFNINENWAAYVSTSNAIVNSFGRYAPTPANLFIPSDSAADPVKGDGRGVFVRHRFAAAGNRDTNTDANVIDVLAGVKGKFFDRVDIDVGIRRNKYNYNEFGTGYIVRALAEAAVRNGSYNLVAPFANSAATLSSIQAVITRRSVWDTKEAFASASFDITKIGDRSVSAIVGAETRKEFYADLYDSLSESGQIEGSAGNSASGGREVKSVFFEVGIPVMKQLEFNLAGRQDRYNDAGSAFSPKVSARWQPLSNLVLRASYGKGFRAPTLDQLTQKPSFSADSVTDRATCIALGNTVARCSSTNPPSIQVDGLVISNPGLRAEKSEQNSLGIVYDATNWLTLSADYYKISITNRISNISAQTVINRTLNPALGSVPSALGVTRDPVTNAISQVIRGSVNEGVVDTEGFDLSAKVNFNLANYGKLQGNFQASFVEKYTIDGGRDLIGDQGVPAYRLNASGTWTYKRVAVNAGYIYIAKQPDSVGEVPTAGYGTTNLSFVYKHPTKTTITIGANNITNKYPELLSVDGRPWNFNLYDALGRQIYFRISQAF